MLGLEMGADDYLARPFSVRELLASLRALLRRGGTVAGVSEARAASGSGSGSDELNEDGCLPPIRYGPLLIEPEKRAVTIGGAGVSLTVMEFDLLYLMACHPGRVYTRAQLLDSIWRIGYEGYELAVNSHINSLRGKIEQDAGRPRYLLTAWGLGYQCLRGQHTTKMMMWIAAVATLSAMLTVPVSAQMMHHKMTMMHQKTAD